MKKVMKRNLKEKSQVIIVVLKKIPGMILCSFVAIVATFLSEVNIGKVSFEVIGAPVFSILIGMLITLCAPKLAKGENVSGGIKFTSKKVLQWAVIILGFSLNLSTIASVGAKSLPVIISTISISLIVAYVMMNVLKLKGNIACLIGVGSSICGGSAIAATAPVIDADDAEVAQSISVIFLFNVLAALVFPVFGRAIGLGSEGFAVFAGTAVNDTSSVTAAAATAEGLYGVEGILSSAVTVKLTRTLAIIPITLVLALVRAKNQSSSNKVTIGKIFPWFILYFIGASLITTLAVFLPDGIGEMYYGVFVPYAKKVSKFFIAMAMGAVGLNTNISELIKKGGKPILLGGCCWLSITAVSLIVQYITGIFFSNL